MMPHFILVVNGLLSLIKKYRNTILLEKQNNLTFYQRHKTCKEITPIIIAQSVYKKKLPPSSPILSGEAKE